MHELKKIRVESIPRSLSKAERYRLLNEPRCAESICRDILAVDAKHADALKILILAITDQFPVLGDARDLRARKDEAESLLARLPDEYSQFYYKGVLLERWSKSLLLNKANPSIVHDFLVRAMEAYAQAEALSDPDNEDAVLRWNTCARIIDRYGLAQRAANPAIHHESYGDEVPFR